MKDDDEELDEFCIYKVDDQEEHELDPLLNELITTHIELDEIGKDLDDLLITYTKKMTRLKKFVRTTVQDDMYREQYIQSDHDYDYKSDHDYDQIMNELIKLQEEKERQQLFTLKYDEEQQRQELFASTKRSFKLRYDADPYNTTLGGQSRNQSRHLEWAVPTYESDQESEQESEQESDQESDQESYQPVTVDIDKLMNSY